MSRSGKRWLVLIAMIFGVPTLSAQDQAEQRHKGFWIGFGLGGGWNEYSESQADAEAGLGVYVRLGGTLSQRVLLGGETYAWVDAQTTAGVARANVTFTAMIFPFRRGLYVKGGLGLSRHERASVAGYVGTFSQTGFGSTWGLGYDIRLGSNLYLTPNVDVLVQGFEVNGSKTTNTISLITLGLVWH